jgi:thiamine biosynthesis protein ThiS
MRLKLNGKVREVEGVSTVEELIASLGVHRMIVVQHNGEILRKEQYPESQLHDGDALEIVHMVGGG